LVGAVPWWLEEQRQAGRFGTDPEWHEAWEDYFRWWSRVSGGYHGLWNLWSPRSDPAYEAARRRVLDITCRVLDAEGCLVADFLRRVTPELIPII
jgi:hypothetical protein